MRTLVHFALALGLTSCLTGDPNPYYAVAGGGSGGSAGSAGAAGAAGSAGSPEAIGQAYAVSSVGDVIPFADDDLPMGSATRTVEAWIKTTFTGEGYFVSYGTTEPNSAFLLGVMNGHAIVTQIGDSVLSAAVVADDRWHHVAVVFTSPVGYALVVDGVADASRALSTDTKQGGRAFIGTWKPQSKAMIGAVDDVRIWSIARTVDDIAHDKGRRLVGDEAGLVAYFPLDADTQNLAQASSAVADPPEGSGSFVAGVVPR